jgi:methylated-DNA-protein-cysteine methyltransferase-like protein
VTGRIPETYARIWKAVCRIPRGRVCTYGTIAHLAGFPSQARLVGYALHSLPDGADVPWHRVINGKGKISPRPGAETQRVLLEREGVRFENNAVSLRRYGWAAPMRNRERSRDTVRRQRSSAAAGRKP